MHNKQFRFPKKVKYLKAYENDLFFACDTSNTFYWFEYPDLKYKQLLTTRYPSVYDSLHHVDADETQNNLVCIHGQLKKIGLFHWDQPRETMIYSWHLSEIEAVKLSPTGEYLCSGDSDGYNYVWNTSSGQVIAVLPRCHDAVSAIAFDRSSKLVAVASFDKTVYLTNIVTMQAKNRIQGFDHAVGEIFFLSSSSIICIERREKVTIWDFVAQEVLHTFTFDAAFISCAALSPDKEYLFIGTQNGGIKAIDLIEREVAKFETLDKIEDFIVAIAFLPHSKTVVYTTDDRKIGFFNLLDDVALLTKELCDALENNHYAHAYRLFLLHPFLRQTPLFDQYNQKWEVALYRGSELLEEGEIEEAREVFLPFHGIPEKREVIGQILNEYRKFPQFRKAYNEGNIPLMYAIASSFPPLKRSKFYKEMEQKWEKVLESISLVATKGAKNIKDVILTLIAPFQGTREKMDVFHLLIKQFEVYLLFQQALQEKDFKKFFILSDTYPVLKVFPEYAQAVIFGDSFLATTLKLIEQERFEDAKRYLTNLKIFPMHYTIAVETEEKIRLAFLFQRRIMNKDYQEVFSMINTTPELAKLRCYQNFEYQIEQEFKRCEPYVAKGDIEKITSIVREFYPISLFFEKIRSLYTAAYSTQFMHEITQGSVTSATVQNSVSLYISLFGLDETMIILLEHIKRRTGFAITVQGMKLRKDFIDFAALKLPDFII